MKVSATKNKEVRIPGKIREQKQKVWQNSADWLIQSEALFSTQSTTETPIYLSDLISFPNSMLPPWMTRHGGAHGVLKWARLAFIFVPFGRVGFSHFHFCTFFCCVWRLLNIRIREVWSLLTPAIALMQEVMRYCRQFRVCYGLFTTIRDHSETVSGGLSQVFTDLLVCTYRCILVCTYICVLY